MAKENKIPKEYGIITRKVAWFFYLLQKLPPQCILGDRDTSFVKNNFDSLSPEQKAAFTIKRSRLIDKYIIGCLSVEISCALLIGIGLATHPVVKWIIITCILLRLIDIIQINVNMSIFDAIKRGSKPNYMASAPRTIINVIINYFELALSFGIIYSFLDIHWITEPKASPFYFSIITQLTMGFGSEASVTGLFKFIACIQLALAYFFSALIIGRFISHLPTSKAIFGNEEAEGGPNNGQQAPIIQDKTQKTE